MSFKKIKKLLSCSMIVTALLLGGCGRIEEVEEETAIELPEGYMNGQSSTMGIDSNSKNFEEMLTNDTFYVVHDGIYYPLYSFYGNEATEDEMYSQANPDRMHFFNLENIKEIPTFYPGDHLVYYSTEYMLDVISWERYLPLGATFGFKDILKNVSGRAYLTMDNDDIVPIIPETSAEVVYELTTPNITIDKVGGIVINDEVLHNGIIVGLTEGVSYDVELYTGTYYKHYTLTADTYAFEGFERFDSVESDTLQKNFWEVGIPEYFVNGYYNLGGYGFLRYVTEDSYSNETNFSEPLLIVDEEVDYNGNKIYPDVFSTVEELNGFKQTKYPDKLGYEDPEQKEEEKEELVEMLPEAAQFKEANVMKYDLWFPKGKICTIEIVSKGENPETTGSANIKFDTGGTAAISYNRFDKVYKAEINGKGNKGTLTISGFWYDYDIRLTNIEMYEGQDMSNEIIESDAVAEESTEAIEKETEASVFEGESAEENSEGGFLDGIMDKIGR